MSYDLAIDRHNDFIWAANKDLMGVSGTALHDQRIRTRLKMKRGSWIFDMDGRLGSRLDLALTQPTEKAMTTVIAYVHEALDDIEDIEVTNVQVKQVTYTTIEIVVEYALVSDPDEAPFIAPEEQVEETTVSFQL